MDSQEDIDDDTYTSDCSEPTSTNNTHAYSQFTIIDGELREKDCIIKPAGKLNKALFQLWFLFRTKYLHIGIILDKGLHHIIP